LDWPLAILNLKKNAVAHFKENNKQQQDGQYTDFAALSNATVYQLPLASAWSICMFTMHQQQYAVSSRLVQAFKTV
jgi:hypothetical protein